MPGYLYIKLQPTHLINWLVHTQCVCFTVQRTLVHVTDIPLNHTGQFNIMNTETLNMLRCGTVPWALLQGKGSSC